MFIAISYLRIYLCTLMLFSVKNIVCQLKGHFPYLSKAFPQWFYYLPEAAFPATPSGITEACIARDDYRYAAKVNTPICGWSWIRVDGDIVGDLRRRCGAGIGFCFRNGRGDGCICWVDDEVVENWWRWCVAWMGFWFFIGIRIFHLVYLHPSPHVTWCR